MSIIQSSSTSYVAPYPRVWQQDQTVRQVQLSASWCSLGGLASKIMFPEADGEKWEKRRIAIQQTMNAENVKFVSALGHQLDGMFYPANLHSSLFLNKAIIFAPGMDGYYEDNYSAYYVSLLRKNFNDVSILIVNYPSVMASKGSLTPDSMALTVFTAFAYLVNEKGFDPNNLLIHGQSLGGVAAVRGGKLVQVEYPDAQVNLISERSFCDLSETAYQAFGCILGAGLRFLVEKAFWSTPDTLEAFNSIKGKKLVIYSKYDGLVKKTASLYRTIKYRIHDESHLRVLKMEGVHVDKNEHFRHFTPNEELALVQEIGQIFGLKSDQSSLVRQICSC